MADLKDVINYIEKREESKKSSKPLEEWISTKEGKTVVDSLPIEERSFLKDIFNRYQGSNLSKVLGAVKKLSPNEIKLGVSREFNKGGTPMMEKQMEMFEDGGLKDEGGMIDEQSGNEVPVGSSRKEVRDDIPAQLSEGEFVFPADVVRYIGLEKLMQLRQQAKMGLQRMEDMGQMGNSDEATMPDDLPFSEADLIIIDGDKEVEMAKGGVLKAADGTDVTTRLLNPSDDIVDKRDRNITFDDMMGGMQMQPKTYENEAGDQLVILHVGGAPMYAPPVGYKLVNGDIDSDTGSDDEGTGTGETTDTSPEYVETPDYGGELDALGMVPGSVGSEQSLRSALSRELELLAGAKPTFIENIISKFGIVKAIKALDKKIMGDDTRATTLNRAVDTLNDMINRGEENTTEFNTLASNFVDAAKGYQSDTDGDGIVDVNEDVSQIMDQDLGFGDITGQTKAIADEKAMTSRETAFGDMNTSNTSVTPSEDQDSEMGGVTSGVGTGSTGAIGLSGEGSDAAGGGPDGTSDAAGGGFSGPSGSGSGSGGVSGDNFGMFNKGGLAGKKPKKKPIRKMKKGGLAASKK
jgi:hypothetical protein